jgi:hypothetical protein
VGPSARSGEPKKMTSTERPMMSLVKRDSKNAGTITATVAKMAPFINTGTINSVFGSGIARYSSSCFFLAHRALAALRAILPQYCIFC